MSRIERASELIGHPVITLDEGVAVGEIKDVLIDPHESRAIGFTVRGSGLLSTANKGVLPIEGIGAIGRDALMVSSADALHEGREEVGRLMSEQQDVIGKEVVTAAGESLGSVSDVILDIEGSSAVVVGYELATSGGENAIVAVPENVAMSGDALVVPEDARSRVTNGLASFRGALERTQG